LLFRAAEFATLFAYVQMSSLPLPVKVGSGALVADPDESEGAADPVESDEAVAGAVPTVTELEDPLLPHADRPRTTAIAAAPMVPTVLARSDVRIPASVPGDVKRTSTAA
jgi:hypothetical protein